MGIGKILTYTTLGIVGGVAAVAAAPFTGGGSLFAAATLATSLAGAGAAAAATGAAVVAGGAGAYLANKENKEEQKIDEELQNLKDTHSKFLLEYEKMLPTLTSQNAYFSVILGMFGLGIIMANADGEISDEEQQEIDDFVSGMTCSQYPPHVSNTIKEFYHNPPTLKEILDTYISKVDPRYYDVLKLFLETVMHADGEIHRKEQIFLDTFEGQLHLVTYQPETTNNDL
jgi:uncharacterized membrane protein YebE (DUF533 family)